MPLTRRTLTLPAALATVALAVAGCGGSDSSSKGASTSAAKDDYARALNSFCTSFKQGVAGVQTAASRIPRNATAKQALGTFATAIDDYATTIRTGVSKLDGVTAPDEYKSFDSGAVKGFEDVATRLETVASKARKGDTKVLKRINSELGTISVPNPPKDLQQKATACNG
jgi:hypothetical protein